MKVIGGINMLYEKCRKILVEDISISISDLMILRTVLSLADEHCNKLSLLDVEKIWFGYQDLYDMEVDVDKDWVKRFIWWIANEFISADEMKLINLEIDKLFNSEK